MPPKPALMARLCPPGWSLFALFTACLLHDRLSLRWTYPGCHEEAGPAIYGAPLPEHMWAYTSLEWHVWVPAYLVNVLALWLVLLLPFSLLKGQDWTRRNGGKAALGAALFIVLDLGVLPGNHLHWTPNGTFMPDAFHQLHAVGWSFQTRNYMCDNSF